ncbi:hypothetical protein VA596_25830 [Amycolatopsis sp., V23-08]|uniref:Membrane-anchored protein n=1 Tax=Amycolatopsis heterodermiae TaxID=3110235 RepID=A0ABU5RCP8_9PSEU|nr:hypothetical protein [Amycolatopsis sp., V23-08]MEA5362976.1 hypothetical protein [Amycolatopsis sp., V23-08]
MTSVRTPLPRSTFLNKVPEVTLYFWLIKVLCTTVGETAADFLNVDLGFGLTGVSLVTGALLVVALVFQFRAARYVAGLYWLTVAIVSVFGTLVTDNLTDNAGLPLEASTLVFGVLLAVTFVVWYASEKTLSIHSIVTRRRETFYWLAILFTFALGTATGDLMAEVLGLGYLVTGGIVVALIAVTALAWRLGLHPVLAFWFIYVLTRPLGASLGDYLSQPSSQGGLGLGATVTSLIFVAAIVVTVVYLSATKADVVPGAVTADEPVRGGMWQTVVFLAVILVAGGVGYTLRTAALQDTSPQVPVALAPVPGAGPAQPVPVHTSPLGDLSVFRGITQDTLNLLNGGNQAGATTRVDDLEIQWDTAEARLKPKDKTEWTNVDGRIDKVLRALRSTSPDQATEKDALTALLTTLG